jgi:hypothetical protein
VRLTDFRSRTAALGFLDSSPGALQGGLVSLALAFTLVALWAATHHDPAITKDGQIYAFQALARLHPTFNNDVYLAFGSQDRYTVFSPLYALLIEALGLANAAVILLVTAKLLFFVAAWQIARRLADRESAWFAVALLIITVGRYGAFDVFNYLESYLSARTWAEALVVCALALSVGGARTGALVVIAAALAIHPLMALPGMLLLLCLWLPLRVAAWGAAAGVACAAALSLGPTLAPIIAAHVPRMDAAWLEVVRERSEFLFVQMWDRDAWDEHARVLLCISVTWIVIPEVRVRRLCAAAVLVGVTGVAVAALAGATTPVPILLQGQAWRWFWVTGFVCVLLLPMTVSRIWRDPTCGPFCALLLLSAWTFAEGGRSGCALLALSLWCLRNRFSAQFGVGLKWAAIGWGILIAGWTLANAWTFFGFRLELHQESLSLQKIREILALQAPAVALFWAVLYAFRRVRGTLVPLSVAISFAAVSAVMLPVSLGLSHRPKAAQDEYADWLRAIPADQNVYVADGTDNPRFVWLELGRPNYLSVDQSAGVVFSRGTALEIERRATDLLPLSPLPDWKIRSHRQLMVAGSGGAAAKASGKEKSDPAVRPLTPAILTQVCADPALGFLVAHESVGFGAITHHGAGKYQDWNLYDCNRVRRLGAAS